MHTVEVLEQAITLAEEFGFQVRQDWFGGAPAGLCEFQGRRWIFIDLALTPREQLEQVLEALRTVPELAEKKLEPPLVDLIQRLRAA